MNSHNRRSLKNMILIPLSKKQPSDLEIGQDVVFLIYLVSLLKKKIRICYRRDIFPQKMRQNKYKSESRGFQKLTFKLPLTFLYQNLLQRKNNSWHCSETLRFKKGTCFCQRVISLDGLSITISFPLSQSEWHQSGKCKIWRLFFIKKLLQTQL